MVRRALAASRERWQWSRQARPVRDEALHLTVHFLGAIETARVASLVDALVVGVPLFALQLERVRVWSNGIAALEPRADATLDDLHCALRDRLEAQGVALESRAFRPHVTLARDAKGSIAPDGVEPVAWPVTSYALVESSGGRYVVLRDYRL